MDFVELAFLSMVAISTRRESEIHLLAFASEFGGTSRLQCTASPSETMTLLMSLNSSVERWYCPLYVLATPLVNDL